MERFRKIDGVRETLGHETNSKGDEFNFWCPNHAHNPSRTVGEVGVNFASDWFHCWHCDWGGKTLLPLFRKGSGYRNQYYSEIQARRGILEKPVRTFDKVSLPDEFETLSRSSRSPFYRQAMDYLTRRGIGSETILRYKLGFCDRGKYARRIMFPSFDEHGGLNFLVGRTWDEHEGMRYLAGNFDKDVVVNDCMVDWDKSVTLTEGPFDAMKSGTNSVPLLGSSIQEGSKLFSKIVTAGVDVYFALDSDMQKKQLRIIGRFVHYGIKCYLVDLGGKKDLGEMALFEIDAARAKALPIESDLDLLRARVLA
jgi:hypothetical protein